MKIFMVELNKVRESGRLDFDFYDPEQAQHINLVKGYSKDILGNLCTKLGTGKTAPRNSYPSSGIRILKVKNTSGNGIKWDVKTFVSDEFYKSAEKKATVQENDILMLCSAHSKVYIGRADIITKFPKEIVDDNGRCICVGELIIIRANPEKVNPEYLITFFRLPIVQEKIRKMVKGQTAHLYPKDLANLEIILPQPEIQDEIAQLNKEAEKEHIKLIKRAEDDLRENRELIMSMILTGENNGIETDENIESDVENDDESIVDE